MLKRVEIKQFRSCQDVVLDNLGPVTVLAGRNAVGKTNILQAIQWAATYAASAKLPQWPGLGGHVAIQAVIGQNTYHYTLRGQIGSVSEEYSLTEELTFEDSDYVRFPLFSRQNEDVRLPHSQLHFRIGAGGSCMRALISLLPADSPDLVAIQPFLSFLERIAYYPLDCPRDAADFDVRRSIVLPDTYNEWLSRYRATGDPGDSALLRLIHLKLTDWPQFDEIRSLLGPNGLGLLHNILMRTVETTGSVETSAKPNDRKETPDRFYWLTFRPSLQSPEAPASAGYFGFDGLSAGTQRVIRIIVSLIFDQCNVMLLEHPEDSIHRGLLRKLMDVLQKYSDQSQLIVSSHSSVVFNALDPGAVRLVTMENGITKVRGLTPQELSVAGRFLEEDGSLSDFLETVEED